MAEKTNGLTPIQNILPSIFKPEMKPLTPIQERLISMPIDAAMETPLSSHAFSSSAAKD
jgi:hypothetical protein